MLRELRRGQVRMPSSSLRNIQAHPKSKAVVMNLARMEWARVSPRYSIVSGQSHQDASEACSPVLGECSLLATVAHLTLHFRGNDREGVYNGNAKIWQSEVHCMLQH